jgi:Nucleotidyl transferase AbiEii toxin, Type IV TA system
MHARMSEPTLPDKLIAVDEALTTAKVAHAFGGALALAYYAEPRATTDIDVNVFCTVDDYPRVAKALAEIGVDAVTDIEKLERSGQCRLRWGRSPIDLFFAYDRLHAEMQRDLRRVPFGEITIPILSPEHLMICKAVFDRSKDWIDIEQMLVVTDDLDVTSVETWLVSILGKDHLSVARLQKIADELMDRSLSSAAP